MDMHRFVESLTVNERHELKTILNKDLSTEEQEVLWYRNGDRVKAIRARRERTYMGLKEAKDSLDVACGFPVYSFKG